MITAMKAQEKNRLEALRYLFSQIKNREIDLKRPLADDEAVKLLQTEAKRRKEAIEAYQKGGRQDLTDKEQYELTIIEEFLPKQLTDEEILAIVSSVKMANSGADFGSLMKQTMNQVAGRAEGLRVSEVLKSLLK